MQDEIFWAVQRAWAGRCLRPCPYVPKASTPLSKYLEEWGSTAMGLTMSYCDAAVRREAATGPHFEHPRIQ
jgi:hypothetical protein